MSYYIDVEERLLDKLRARSDESSPPNHFISIKYERRLRSRLVHQILPEPDENNNNIIDQVIQEELVYHPPPVNRRLFDNTTPKQRNIETSTSSSPEDSEMIKIGEHFYKKKRQFSDVFEQDIEYDHKRHKIDNQDEVMIFEPTSINYSIKLR